MSIIVDSGPLYAVADRHDGWHARCVEFFDREREALSVPLPVVTEVCHLLATRIGSAAEEHFIASIVAGELELTDFTPQDLERTFELVRRYADLPLGFADAAVVATAERLAMGRVATTDQRHFSVVRPHRIDAFELVPDPT